jgi:hypothetical protein
MRYKLDNENKVQTWSSYYPKTVKLYMASVNTLCKCIFFRQCVFLFQANEQFGSLSQHKTDRYQRDFAPRHTKPSHAHYEPQTHAPAAPSFDHPHNSSDEEVVDETRLDVLPLGYLEAVHQQALPQHRIPNFITTQTLFLASSIQN